MSKNGGYLNIKWATWVEKVRHDDSPSELGVPYVQSHIPSSEQT